jgi:hypothetical protein
MKTISKLKKELDTIFSIYIRLRDADSNGLVFCFTCGKVANYKKGMQCGHFQSRRHTSTRWDGQNCQPQCVRCNMFNQGEQFKFGLNLDAKYGEGTADKLVFISNQTRKFARADYELLLTYYKALVEKLKKEKGIK